MADSYYDKLTMGEAVPTTDIEYIGRETAEEKDFLGAALEEAMVPFAAKRVWDRRSSQFEEDVDWMVDEKLDADIKANYTADEEKYLKESGSEDEFLARRTHIKEDQERISAMISGGWKGIGAMLAFSIIDPVSIGLSAATGGISYLSKGTGIARAAKIATVSGLENVAIDTMLMQGNTQYKTSDLIISFGAGAVIGGGIGLLRRAENPRLSTEVDAADAAVHADSDMHVINSTVVEASREADLPIKKAYPGVDAKAVQARMTEYEVGLKKDVGGAIHPTTAKKIGKRIKEVKKRIDIENEDIRVAQSELTVKREAISMEKKRFIEDAGIAEARVTELHAKRIADQELKVRKVEANLAKKVDDQKQAAKLWKQETKLEEMRRARDIEIRTVREKLSARVTAAEAKFARAFQARASKAKAARRVLETNLVEYQARLERASKAKRSAKEIKEWNRMSEHDRIKHVYGDEKLPDAKVELARQVDGYAPVRTGAPEPSTVGVVREVEPGTGGAARIDEKPLHRVYDIDWEDQKTLSQYAYDGSNVPESLRGVRLPFRSGFTDAMHSAQTMISNSKDYAIRGFGYHLFEAPQGGTAAKVTVAARVKNFSTQIRSAMRNRLNEGLEEWGKENGLTRYATLMEQENYRSYNKAVMIEVQRPGTYANSPGIIKGAEGVREQFKTAGMIRSDAGEAGFDNIDFDANYTPIIVNETAVKNALINHPKHRVVDLLSLGYQRGGLKLNEALADRVAEAYVVRSRNHTLTMSDAVRVSSDPDIKGLAKQLEEAGVDKDIIDDFLDVSLEGEIKQHMSNRAKKSLHPDISVELNGLKFIDLIDHDLPKLLESYTRDAAGGAAFAKMGFKTRRDVLDMLTTLEQASTNNGFSPHEIAKEIQILKDGVDMAYGRSLNQNAHSPFVRNLSRLRDLTGLLRLQFVGAASIPELARVTAQRSLSSVLEACPDLGAIRGTKNIRSGGKYSGHFERKDLDEIEQVLGYVGEDHVLYPNGLRADDLEEVDVSGRFGTYFDNAMAQGRRLQEVASGFRMIQGSGEKIAARTLASDIKKWAVDGGKALSEANINRAGWSDDFLGDVKKFMSENPAYDDFNGKKVTLFNFGKMAPEMQERLQIGMHRLVMADMQRPFIGETPMFMHKWLGQTLTQFRSFSILSLEKQLVHDIRNDKVMGGIMAMHSLLLSYISLGVSSMQRNIGREDAAERIENDLTGKNAIVGSINRMGQLASVGICEDLMASFGLLPDALLASRDEYGARALTTGSIPVMGLAQDLLQAPKAVADLIKGKEDANKALKEVQDVIPFSKAIGINQALNVLKETLK